MRAPDGNEHRATGVYREVDPPNKVVYTWGWEGEHKVKDSVVTVEFLPRGDDTEVVLTHAGIADEQERTHHTQGWTAIIDKFEAVFAGAGS